MNKEQSALSFGITTCGQMVGKLERELERLVRGTLDPRAVNDHALNCALTADAMVDWVWQLHFWERPEAQQQLGCKVLGRDRNKIPIEFRQALSGRCQAVGICNDLARGIKHAFATRGQLPTITTSVATHAPSPLALGSSRLGEEGLLTDDDGSLSSERQCSPKITMDDGKVRHAIAVFDQVASFWKDVLRELDID